MDDLLRGEIMCDFCTFEYGVSKMQIQRPITTDKAFTWEIRPTVAGKHTLFVRLLKKEGTDIAIDKSTIFIEHCPICGRKL